MKTKWRSHQTPCKGRRSARTTWEGGALGGVGGRKEPATSNTAGASSWWGSSIQCGGTPRMMAGCALGGVGFVKQGGGEEEPKEVWGTRLAMMVVEVTGTCAGGRQSKQQLGGGSSLHSTFFITRWAPIQTTSWRGVVLALNLLHHQGGAQNSQKSWKLRSDQDGGSGGHLLGQRQMQVSEKATGDLLVFIFVKFL